MTGIGVCASVDVSDVLATVTVIEVLASVTGIGVLASVDVSDVLVSVNVSDVRVAASVIAIGWCFSDCHWSAGVNGYLWCRNLRHIPEP